MMWVWFWALLHGPSLWCCCKLWHRWQRQLRSSVAMAVTQARNSNSAPILGIPMCHRCGCKKKRKKKPVSLSIFYTLAFELYTKSICMLKYEKLFLEVKKIKCWQFQPYISSINRKLQLDFFKKIENRSTKTCVHMLNRNFVHNYEDLEAIRCH